MPDVDIDAVIQIGDILFDLINVNDALDLLTRVSGVKQKDIWEAWREWRNA